jgi:hypothetical protein
MVIKLCYLLHITIRMGAGRGGGIYARNADRSPLHPNFSRSRSATRSAVNARMNSSITRPLRCDTVRNSRAARRTSSSLALEIDARVYEVGSRFSSVSPSPSWSDSSDSECGNPSSVRASVIFRRYVWFAQLHSSPRMPLHSHRSHGLVSSRHLQHVHSLLGVSQMSHSDSVS